ncbi:MAG: Uma2 family endonuclease [Sciscionella sp.]
MSIASWPAHLLSLADWAALPVDTDRRYELVEGARIVSPRPASLHQRVLSRLLRQLDQQLPKHWEALSEVEVVISAGGPATVRVPDIAVIPTSLADTDRQQFHGNDVLIAVEIVSPGSARTDRVAKRAEYAEAGIEHYWIVEIDPPATLTAYHLMAGEYEQNAHTSGLITVNTPTPVTLDIATLIASR